MRRTNTAIIYFLLGILMVNSCSNCNDSKKPIREIKVAKSETVKVEVVDFYKDLLEVSSRQDSMGFSMMRKKYGAFFEQFNTGVLNIGSSRSPIYLERLQSFTGDKDIRYLYKCVDSVFTAKDRANLQASFDESFTLYKAVFKNHSLPKIAYQISGFNYAMVCSDSILGIGLDFYLGKNFKYYGYLQYPEYKKRVMQKEYILPHALYAWFKTEFDTTDGASNLLGEMVNEGKILYFIQNLKPEMQDTILFGYTQKQLEWCIYNEFNIWRTLVDKKMLFSTNAIENQKMISEGPFTTGFPRESPGRLGWFMGYRIVESYMKNNPDVSLEQLMANNDAALILSKSKYKPKK